MIVAENPKFIFVHVYKTGGTSIKRSLRRYAMQPGQEFANFFFKRLGIRQFGPTYYPDHFSASDLIEQIGQQKFKSYFSFGFVRNPWSWEVSTYKYILKNRKHPDHQRVSSFHDFREYLHWRCDGRFQLQQDFLYHDGKQVVDFVGRFEHLERDFQEICLRLNLSHRLPALNQSGGRGFRRYYTSDLIEMVRSTYRPDIEEFGYRFDPSSQAA